MGRGGLIASPAACHDGVGRTVTGVRPIWRDALKRETAREAYMLSLAESYARDHMEEYGARVAVDVAQTSPRSLPTFWSSALVHVARIREVLVARVSPSGRKAPDQIDLMHLDEAAAYADLFVTSDRRLRAFAAKVHALSCEVVSLDEWVARIDR